jgi:hypothetical protein
LLRHFVARFFSARMVNQQDTTAGNSRLSDADECPQLLFKIVLVHPVYACG